jgi:hypothetical protein
MNKDNVYNRFILKQGSFIACNINYNGIVRKMKLQQLFGIPELED